MKKVGLLFMFVLTLFTLSACAMPWQVEEVDMQTKLMDARKTGRDASIGIKVRLSNRTIISSGEANSYGSGVVFFVSDEYYYALTNDHVVDDKGYRYKHYMIHTKEGNEIEAEVLHMDPHYDLALLRFEIGDIKLTPINIDARLNEALFRGEMLLAIGYPSEVPGVVTYGEYLGMSLTDKVDFRVISHSALIFPGNSGGALIDLEGNLVGINTWSSARTEERYMAIPLTEIHNFIEESGYFEVE